MFIVKVDRLRHVNELNDTAIEFVCYLSSDDNTVYKNSDGSFKFFTVRFPKSTTDSSWTNEQIVNETKRVIYNDFQITGLVTVPSYSELTDVNTSGINVVRFSETDVKKLCVGMTLIGPGYDRSEYDGNYIQTGPNSNLVILRSDSAIPWDNNLIGMKIVSSVLPEDTYIVSLGSISRSLILSNSSRYPVASGIEASIFRKEQHPTIVTIANKQDVIISKKIFFYFQGNVIDPNVECSATGNMDGITLTLSVSVKDWFIGATITGDGIPMNTSITDDWSNMYGPGNIIRLSQKLIKDVDQAAVIISKNPDSQYIRTRSIPFVYNTEDYAGINVSGYGVLDNTSILGTNYYNDENEFSLLGTCNYLKLSMPANAGVTSIFSFHNFSFSNITFTACILPNGDLNDEWGASNIDFSDILRVASIVDFSLI